LVLSSSFIIAPFYLANCESGLKGEGSKETEDVEGKKGAKKQPPEGRRKGLLK
jgi:hypothetical protein